MGKWIGIVCIILGAACLLSAVGLLFYNRWEADNAAEVSESLLADVRLAIQQTREDQPRRDEDSAVPESLPMKPEKGSAMATVLVDGDECIGVLSVPALELELPVLTDWSYNKLKKAPCHYYGSYHDKNFVIAAHNYQAHFGRLSQLQPGDTVMFTDVNGNVFCYEVVLQETLPPDATQAMITSGFDLSLYTCTLGGGSRVTVRCNTVKI